MQANQTAWGLPYNYSLNVNSCHLYCYFQNKRIGKFHSSHYQSTINFPYYSIQFSSVALWCPTFCDLMNHSMPGLPVHHQLPEFTQTHVHWVGDDIQPAHPLLSPSTPAPSPSQHQGLSQWVNSLHEVAKVLEFHFQRQSFQWTPRTDLL